MKDWGVVEGVSYSYVVKGYLVSGQVKEKEGEKALWDCPGKGEDLKVLWVSIHGLKWTDIEVYFLVRPGPLRVLKGRVNSVLMKFDH